jgi:hypothetical protein
MLSFFCIWICGSVPLEQSDGVNKSSIFKSLYLFGWCNMNIQFQCQNYGRPCDLSKHKMKTISENVVTALFEFQFVLSLTV